MALAPKKPLKLEAGQSQKLRFELNSAISGAYLRHSRAVTAK